MGKSCFYSYRVAQDTLIKVNPLIQNVTLFYSLFDKALYVGRSITGRESTFHSNKTSMFKCFDQILFTGNTYRNYLILSFKNSPFKALQKCDPLTLDDLGRGYNPPPPSSTPAYPPLVTNTRDIDRE